MTVAELVSEFMYAGKTLAEIAHYNVYQIRQCLFRRRDKYGHLVKVDPDVPWYVQESTDDDGMRRVKRGSGLPFQEVFRRRKRRQGMTAAQIEAAWDEYVEGQPISPYSRKNQLSTLVARERARRERARPGGY